MRPASNSLLWATLHCALFASALSGASSTDLSRDHLLFSRTPEGQIQPIRSPSEWKKRRAEILSSMQEVMGPLPGPEKRCALEVELVEEVDCGTYVRRLIRYQAEPGNRVPAYLLIPKKALGGSAPAPGVLALHQTHSEGQKVVVGLGNSPDDEYGVELVKRGYVCLAPPYPMLANYWPDVKKLGWESGTMLGIWINIRGLDLLESLPFVKHGRYGSIGHSLGGHNGIYTAAFDERIHVVVSSCGLDSYRDYYDGDPKNWQPERGWCQRRYMPRLASYGARLSEIPFDFPEILASIAPRRIFINAPLGDSNFRWRSVDRVASVANEVFALWGEEMKITVVHPEGPHRFATEIRQQAYAVLEEVLRPPLKHDAR